MKIDRLISIIMILNNEEKVTAKELSERLEVSTKTIQRDIEAISMAGIPITSQKGFEGGYGIMESYKINKASMTNEEVTLLKGLLKGINETYKNKEVLSLINKLTIMESKNNKASNLIIDFSRWEKSNEITDKINIIDKSINNSEYITFNYNKWDGSSINRKVEPYKIIFKALNWYLYGYCTLKEDMRLFKVTRMIDLRVVDEEFEGRNIDTDNLFKEPELETVEITLRIKKEFKNILEDNFPSYEIVNEDTRYIIIKISLPYNNWVYNMILSFEDKIEIIEPQFIREEIKSKIKNMYNMYK